MKLFRELMPFVVSYGNLEEFGFVAPNRFRKYLCDFTSLLGYVVLVSGTLLAGGFLAFEAETFEEIYEHFYEFATGLNYTFYFISTHWMCKQFFELNDSYEEIIKKREFISDNQQKIKLFEIKLDDDFKGSINGEKREIYEKASQFIEILSNYMYIGYVKVVFPLSTVPYLIMSYFNYYTTELGKDAFILPFVMWYVNHDNFV